MADVPVGTFLSGGIDSSLVTAYVHDEQPGVVAFNASVTDQPADDEHPFATRVADHLGVELQTVAMSAATWRADFVDAVQHNEYPLMHESSVPMFQIASLARSGGVKVLLSGEGADELFGGYGFLHAGLYLDYLRSHRRVRSLAGLALAKLRRDGLAGLVRRNAAMSEPPPVVAPEASADSVAFDREAARPRGQGLRDARARAGRARGRAPPRALDLPPPPPEPPGQEHDAGIDRDARPVPRPPPRCARGLPAARSPDGAGPQGPPARPFGPPAAARGRAPAEARLRLRRRAATSSRPRGPSSCSTAPCASCSESTGSGGPRPWCRRAARRRRCGCGRARCGAARSSTRQPAGEVEDALWRSG